jgi:hypothetical protein
VGLEAGCGAVVTDLDPLAALGSVPLEAVGQVQEHVAAVQSDAVHDVVQGHIRPDLLCRTDRQAGSTREHVSHKTRELGRLNRQAGG